MPLIEHSSICNIFRKNFCLFLASPERAALKGGGGVLERLVRRTLGPNGGFVLRQKQRSSKVYHSGERDLTLAQGLDRFDNDRRRVSFFYLRLYLNSNLFFYLYLYLSEAGEQQGQEPWQEHTAWRD